MEKAVALLSGGIDSPVAIALMKERLEVIAVHFHQQPLSGEKEIEKVKELAKKLELSKIYLIPFVDVLKELTQKCSHNHYFLLSKILMFKTAEKIASRESGKYLITGENLAQVSSQTLSNLTTITKFIGLEIFRPVLTFDKQEIISKAEKIGTYELSKGPELCCLLGPKHPATKSSAQQMQKELEKIDAEQLIKQSLERAEILQF